MAFHVRAGFFQPLPDASALSKMGGASSRVPWNDGRTEWQTQREEGAPPFLLFGAALSFSRVESGIGL